MSLTFSSIWHRWQQHSTLAGVSARKINLLIFNVFSTGVVRGIVRGSTPDGVATFRAPPPREHMQPCEPRDETRAYGRFGPPMVGLRACEATASLSTDSTKQHLVFDATRGSPHVRGDADRRKSFKPSTLAGPMGTPAFREDAPVRVWATGRTGRRRRWRGSWGTQGVVWGR